MLTRSPSSLSLWVLSAVVAASPIAACGGKGGSVGSGGHTSGTGGPATGSGAGGQTDGGPGDAGGDGATSSGPALPPLPAGVGSGTTYYVSPSGSDSNDGKSKTSPWQTLGKVTSTTFGPGDTVLFEGGAKFSGCPVFSGDKIKSTAAAPFTVGSYGTGSFTLAASCTGSHKAALSILGVNGFYLHGATVVGNAGGAEYGIFINNPTGTTTDWVRVEGCDVSGFYTTDKTDYGAEIFVSGVPGGLDHVLLLDNTLHGSQGETSPDDNGISGYGNGTNITNALYQGNTVYDIGAKPGANGGTVGNGILAGGLKDGVVQYNVAYNLGRNTNTCGGPAAIWAYSCDHVTFQYNEAYGSGPNGGQAAGGCDWNAYDLDGNVVNSVLQYNYAHDNFGAGYLLYVNGTWGGNVVRYNISENDGHGVGAGIFVTGYGASGSDLAIYGNTVYTAKGDTFGIGVAGGGTIAGHVSNNLFYSDTGGGNLVGVVDWNTATITGLSFLGNDYYAVGPFAIHYDKTSYASLSAWSQATGQEKDNGAQGGLSVDPKLTSPGHGGTAFGYQPAKLGGYLLQAGSPLIGVGLDLHARYGLDVGTQDFFGAAVPNGKGSGFNLGADGAHH
jgi:hypothetical protein